MIKIIFILFTLCIKLLLLEICLSLCIGIPLYLFMLCVKKTSNININLITIFFLPFLILSEKGRKKIYNNLKEE